MFLNNLYFEVQTGIPFGFFYMIIAREGPTQTNDRLFNILTNGIMITNVLNAFYKIC